MADPYKWLWGDDEADFWGDVAPDMGFGYDPGDWTDSTFYSPDETDYLPYTLEETPYFSSFMDDIPEVKTYSSPSEGFEQYQQQIEYGKNYPSETKEWITTEQGNVIPNPGQNMGFGYSEEDFEKTWSEELGDWVSSAAQTSREFISEWSGIPTGDIAKIAGYFKSQDQARPSGSRFQGPQRRQLPTASLRGKPQMSAAGRSPTTDEVIKTMIASNRTASTAANSAKSQTSQGQAAIFKNLTDKLEEYGEASTATKPKGPNIPQSEIRLSRRSEIT